MMKKENYKVGNKTYTRVRWVGRRLSPPGEKRVPFPVRIPARLAVRADKKRGQHSRAWAVEQALSLWVEYQDVDIRRIVSTKTSQL